MFNNKNISENARFQNQYCQGFNVGVSLVKNIAPENRELAKEVLHAMILEEPKNVSFRSILTGFTYEIIHERSREINQQRMKEIEKINQKTKNQEQERGR